MRLEVVYQFTVQPKCTLETGTYIGCTERMPRVRVAGHLGISHRTNLNLNVKEISAIRDHITKCRSSIGVIMLKYLIGTYNNNKYSLVIAESM